MAEVSWGVTPVFAIPKLLIWARLELPQTWFPHLYKGNNRTYHKRLLRELNEIIHGVSSMLLL